ncbi:anthrone oxygenase family protein [Kribbella pittospori]|uniref:anthrone oxygenase family protein n=1 Tax=Kribbella pittospori TaxID=722689 RepID=UPI001EE141A2|nr:anthrone oxygenase family protein [Kribbella pittospori]
MLVLELALRGLDGPEYTRVRRAEFGPFSWFIGAAFTAAFVTSVLLVVHTHRAHSRVFRPAAIALALLLLAVVVTITVNGPINFEQQSWNATAPPPTWEQVRDRWQIAHAVRTAALVLALAFLNTPSKHAQETPQHSA